MALSWDWESRSPIDLKARGAYVYAQHPETDALIASYRLKGSGPAVDAWSAAQGLVNHLYRWKRGEPCPAHVRAYIEAGGELQAHNCAFERLIWQHIMTPRHGWPVLRIEQCRCTAVTAAAMSLPRDLERLGDALDLKIKKDKRGAALMKIHSIPQKDGSWHPLADDPVSMEAYATYCDFDVLSEDEAADRLIPLSDEEMRVYWMNERINDRGLRIDVRSARAALDLIDKAKRALDAEMTTVTGNVVTAVTQAARLKKWVEAQGVIMPTMDKDDVDDFLHNMDDLPGDVRRALELRAEGAKPSVDKISAMLGRVCHDARARGVYLHHGAGQTGRFSSRGVQAHNMPKYRKIFEDTHLDQNILFNLIRQADPHLLQEVYGAELGRPLHLLSDAVRGFIWADPGHDLLVADYASIEGRLADWFAGEEWELDAYRALDRGEGHGIYELNAAAIYNIMVELVTKAQRAGGKVAVLACIEEGQLVLTDSGLIPIEQVPLYSRVWDGVEWVSHDGPVFRGYRDVIDYEGLRATTDHIVFTKEGRQISFGTAASEQESLAKTGVGWQAIRLGDGDKPNSRMARDGQTSKWFDIKIPLPALSLRELQKRKTHQPRQSSQREDQRLRGLYKTTTSPQMARQKSACSPPTLRLSAGPRLQTLRRERGTVQIRIGTCLLRLDHEELIARRGQRDRSNRQQRPLRGRQYKILDSSSKSKQSTQHCFHPIRTATHSGQRRFPCVPLPLPSRTLCRSHVSPITRQSAIAKSNSRSVAHPLVQAKRPVWDILNAGPRHRFTVSDRLVHNCQYASGPGGIRKFARQNKVRLSAIYEGLWASADHKTREFVEKRLADRIAHHDQNVEALGREGWMAAEMIKVGWRNKHPKIVAFWKTLEEAAINATNNPGQEFSVSHGSSNGLACTYKTAHGFLWCRLPSGRCLAYGKPKMREVEAPWADPTVAAPLREKKLSLTVRGVDAVTEKWMRFPVYGGSLFNNLVQGSARDILVHGMATAEERYGALTGHTHDELFVEVPHGSADVRAFEKLICELPSWAATLPLTAAGFVSKRYAKR